MTYQQKRIPKGSPGYQIATDAISQRGGSFDITQIITARWLDMYAENISPEEATLRIEFQAALTGLSDRALDLEPSEIRAELQTIQAPLRGLRPIDKFLRTLRLSEIHYGHDEVAGFLEEYHPHVAKFAKAL